MIIVFVSSLGTMTVPSSSVTCATSPNFHLIKSPLPAQKRKQEDKLLTRVKVAKMPSLEVVPAPIPVVAQAQNSVFEQETQTPTSKFEFEALTLNLEEIGPLDRPMWGSKALNTNMAACSTQTSPGANICKGSIMVAGSL